MQLSGRGEWRFGDFLLGLEGLAILRRWLTDPDAVRARVAEASDLLHRLDHAPFADVEEIPERDTTTGYQTWADTYDDISNPMLDVELRAIAPALDALQAGIVVDVACGTGRHAQHLERRGHRVVGIDLSPEMLAGARRRCADCTLLRASLLRLPLAHGSVDAALCALALTHFTELEAPISELARVVRPGGKVIISDVHPVAVALGAHAVYRDAQQHASFVRNHLHWHNRYINAFNRSRLMIAACTELSYNNVELTAFRMWQEMPAATETALEDLPVVLVSELERR
jgi:ubiquinone/menaquinone biosynthesis C-methylase UbiE